MTVDAVTEGWELVKRFLAPDALYQISVSRDETDSFVIHIEHNASVEGPLLTREQIFPLLPQGSQWEAACGWRSFFGQPFSPQGQEWLALGVEGIRAHETRGAYPVFLGLLFPIDKIPKEQLLDIANTIDPPSLHVGGTEAAYGVVQASSRSPETHKPVEAGIIRRAVDSYDRDKEFCFRTLILTESQVPSLRTLNKKRYLSATVPQIRDGFSWRNEKLLWLYRVVM